MCFGIDHILKGHFECRTLFVIHPGGRWPCSWSAVFASVSVYVRAQRSNFFEVIDAPALHTAATLARESPSRAAMYEPFFLVLISLTVVVRFAESYVNRKQRASGQGTGELLSSGEGAPVSSDFSAFQANYLLVYLLAVTADWIQGPYIYALYTNYGFTKHDIGQLYIAGFASSAVFGTIVASMADKFGRRNNALLYCFIYILSCLTKHSVNFKVLLVGRILGGIATSILFSAFESWMVYEHFAHRFSPTWLRETFAKAQFGNGIVAIVSGLVAGYFAKRFGKVMPFDIAILVLSTLAAVITATWTENYGDEKQSVHGGFAQAWASLISNEVILLLGVTQACFESALYMFIFVWTPALQPMSDKAAEIPHGIIFATFMAATMMGSSLFAILSHYARVEIIMRNMFVLGIAAFTIPLVARSKPVMYLAFVMFEVLCGIYFPAMATMRSPYIPEESRSALLNFFRVPLNVIVVLALYEDLPNTTILALCGCLMVCASVSQIRLIRIARTVPSSPRLKTTPTKAKLLKEAEAEP